VSFDYYLVPIPPIEEFDDEALAAMTAYWESFPTWSAEAGSFTLFGDESSRALALERYEHEPPGNDYTVDEVHASSKNVHLSIVPENVTNKIVYDFAVWCLERWPCQLEYAGQPVAPEELLPAVED
jgi:hypothetical protein